MQVYLKIKIKSLVQEARDIRREERRVNIGARARTRLRRDLKLEKARLPSGDRNEAFSQAELLRIEKKLAHSRAGLLHAKANEAFWGLRHHRKVEVRGHARSSFLAYGFIRGKEYSQIEQNAKFWPDWAEVERLIKKYSEEGSQAWGDRFKEFKIASGFVLKH